MSGLLRRIRRPGAAEEPRTEATALPEPAHGSAPSPADGHPAAADGRTVPAGVAPEDLERRRATGRRGKLRRRARFLRRARELALRDLGGLVYEARRRGHEPGALLDEKVQRLTALDTELRGLEAELGVARGGAVLREPGVGGTCPRCGELHASDARFCARCGLDLAAGEGTAPAGEVTAGGGATAEGATAEAATAEGAAPARDADGAGEPAPQPAAVAAGPAPSEAPTSEVPVRAQAGNGRAERPAETPDRSA